MDARGAIDFYMIVCYTERRIEKLSKTKTVCHTGGLKVNKLEVSKKGLILWLVSLALTVAQLFWGVFVWASTPSWPVVGVWVALVVALFFSMGLAIKHKNKNGQA